MKRIAGTFVLLAGLGGCASFTAAKKTTDDDKPAPNHESIQPSDAPLAANAQRQVPAPMPERAPLAYSPAAHPHPASLPPAVASAPPSPVQQASFTAAVANAEPVVNAAREEPKRPAPEPRAAAGKGAAPLVRLVNTKRITLNFEVKDAGPAGVSGVELWYTRDCREWKKYDAPTKAQAYVIEVDEEGVYGFTLLAKGDNGVGKEPPRACEPPQVWVVVDLSKPDVRLTEVTPGPSKQITLGWRASDKNLSRQPISLYYAEKEDGPWKVVAANLENTGKFVWQAPPGLARTHFKVEAADLAGNVGQATSGKPVLLETAMPTVSITNVDPAPMN